MVGSHLAEYLLENTDWDVVGMMRWNEPLDNLEGLADRINRKDRMSIVYADLNDAGSMRNAVNGMDYIFHLAAQSYPKTSFDIPSETLSTNIIGTLNLLEAVRHTAPKAWVHVCSSSEVYGRVPREFIPIKESCKFHPASPYAISKAGTDLIGQFYAQAYGLKVIVTRMFTHTGPRRGDVFAESSFAKQIAMIEAGKTQPPIKVGNLSSLRTVADVRDAVRAYYMLLTTNPQAGEVYNIGGTHTCTVGDILNALFDVSGNRYPVEVDTERLRPIDADLQVPDCSKFKAHTGWEPKIPFEQTMRDLLNYWRARVKLRTYMTR
jgi:GDP-mannose 4,6-dehydratase